jgi:hypothetical protein
MASRGLALRRMLANPSFVINRLSFEKKEEKNDVIESNQAIKSS